jgi:hypothetical protein
VLNDARVSQRALLDQHSTAQDQARIFGGQIINSTIAGETVIAGDVQIINSTLQCSSVSDNAIIEGVILVGDIIVEGACVLSGPWSLSSGYGVWLHRGCWTEPPRVHKFARYAVSECKDGYVHIGCRCSPIRDWLRNGRTIARRLGWSKDETDELVAVLLAWQ